MGVTRSATVEEYVRWLTGYFTQGGLPTHFYDYPMANLGLAYAVADVTVDGDTEMGAQSRRILVPPRIRVRFRGGSGHTQVFFMRGYRAINPLLIPLFSDPAFEEILTPRLRAARDVAHAEDALVQARSELASYEQRERRQ